MMGRRIRPEAGQGNDREADSMHPSVATVTAILVPFAFLLAGPAAAGGQESAVRREGDRWILSTATVERVVALEDGRFLLREAENMGFPGVELTWRPGSDDNWLSHYEVLRDGEVIDVVAKGTFAFDHSAAPTRPPATRSGRSTGRGTSPGRSGRAVPPAGGAGSSTMPPAEASASPGSGGTRPEPDSSMPGRSP